MKIKTKRTNGFFGIILLILTISILIGPHMFEVSGNRPIDIDSTSITDKAIANKYAPIIWQRASVNDYTPFVGDEDWKAIPYTGDYITKVDYDYDGSIDPYDDNFDTTNNWDNLARTSTTTNDLRPFVYYWISESSTHYFLGYMLYYPRDWDDGQHDSSAFNVISEHENDAETVRVVVEKGSTVNDDRVAYMETKAHGSVYRYIATATDQPNYPYSDTLMGLTSDGHPNVWVQSKGHGVFGEDSGNNLGGGKTWSFDYSKPWVHYSPINQSLGQVAQTPDLHIQCGYDVDPNWDSQCSDDATYRAYAKYDLIAINQIFNAKDRVKSDGTLFESSNDYSFAGDGSGGCGMDGWNFLWFECKNNAANTPWLAGDNAEYWYDPISYLELPISDVRQSHLVLENTELEFTQQIYWETYNGILTIEVVGGYDIYEMVEFTITGPLLSSITQTINLQDTSGNPTNTWSVVWDSRYLPDGTYSIRNQAFDYDFGFTTSINSILVIIENGISATVNSHYDGQTVSGVDGVDVFVDYLDENYLLSAWFSIDGGVLIEDDTPENAIYLDGTFFSWIWDTKTVTNGIHTLTFYILDRADNLHEFSIQVNVYNSVAPPGGGGRCPPICIQ